LNALENKYRAEIRDLQKFLTETKERAKESENSLRNEIQSLKGIIQDLENRLGRYLYNIIQDLENRLGRYLYRV